jgi:nucleotide-binding universal stress UspA family protein
MLSVNKIVVPTDFSDPAREGFRKACQVAKHFGAELVAVHVIPPVPVIPAVHGAVPYNVQGYREEVKKVSKANLEAFLVEETCAEVAVIPLVREGDVAEEIVRAAQEQQADLIVTATHGYSGWKKFILGSVTEKVVRIATMPVLTIREPEE